MTGEHSKAIRDELQQALLSHPSPKYSPREKLVKEIAGSLLATANPHLRFLPDASIGGLLTDKTVRSVIDEAIATQLSDELTRHLVDFVRKKAKKIFCILATMKEVKSILEFYNNHKSDSVLPINESSLKDICPSIDFTRFNYKQWRYLSPILDGTFQRFDNESILPFKEDKRIPGAEGGYGEVHKVLIYSNHQNLTEVTQSTGETISVARKSYIRGVKDEKLFSRERRCWKLLTILRHPHIIDFLGSYYYQENFHIICGLAEMNLKDFMKRETRLPGFEANEDFYRSVLGLSSALRGIHYYEIDPTYGEYCAIGLHHDIKPQNILIKGGKFLWADFGTARVKIDCDNSKTGHQHASVVYEAPESVVGGKRQQVGRSIDVWAFGCVLCEIVSYMLFGKSGVERLNACRARLPNSEAIDWTDSFHSEGKLKPRVEAWIEELGEAAARAGENCMIRLIGCFKSMLVPQDRRPNAKEVHKTVSSIFEMFDFAEIRLHEGSRPARSLVGSVPVDGVERFEPLLSELKPKLRNRKKSTNAQPQLRGVAASGRDIGLLLEPDMPDTKIPTTPRAPALSGNMSILQPPRIPDPNRLSLGFRGGDHQTLESYVQWLQDEGTTQNIRSRGVNLRGRDGRTPLHQAIIERNGLMIQSLLDLGARPEKPDNDGRTALHWAAYLGDLQLIQKLLSIGAVNISTQSDNYGLTPLHWAARYGHEQIVKCLLEVTQDTTPDLKDHSNRTPLHLAAMKGLDSVVPCLLRNGAQAKAKDNDGLTPLHLAAISGSASVVKLLLDGGLEVDPNTKDVKERTALFYAAESGHESVVRLLLKNPDTKPDHADLFESTPLFVAVRNGHDTVVRRLLDSHADPDIRDCMQRTAVHWAAVNGRKTILELLLMHKAQPDSTDQQFYSPLHLAILNFHDDISIRLLDAGADPSRSNSNGTTALHLAASNGLESVVQKILHMGHLNPWILCDALQYAACNGYTCVVSDLLDAPGVNPNHSNSSKRTAIHLAADNGYTDVTKLLLTKGAHLEQKDDKGRTALHWAARRGHGPVIEHLIDIYGANPDQKDNDMLTALHYTTANGHNSATKLLLKKGADRRMLDNQRRNAAHWAARGGHKRVLEYLLNIGGDDSYDEAPGLHLIKHKGHLSLPIDINRQDNKGLTPLHLAAEGGHAQVVKLLKQVLKKQGADLSSLDNYSQTALHLAAIGGHQKVVECLLETPMETNPNISDSYGRTALHLAYINNHEPVVRLLLRCPGVNLPDADTTARLLHWAAENGHGSIVKLLRSAKVDLNIKDSQRRNSLHLAAIWGHIEVVRILMPHPEHPSREIVNIVDGNGLTATQHAAKNQHELVLRFLLGERHGRLSTADAMAALFWAAKKGCYELVSLLLSVPGVDPNSRNHKGQTALHLAAIEGHKNAVSCLLGIRTPEMQGRWEPSREAADQRVLDRNGDTALDLAFINNRKSVVEFLLTKSKLAAFCGDYKGLREWALANHCREVVTLLQKLQIYTFKLILRDIDGVRYIKGEIHRGGSVMAGIDSQDQPAIEDGEVLQLHSFSYNLGEERDLLIYLHEGCGGNIFIGEYQDDCLGRFGQPPESNSEMIASLPTSPRIPRRILPKENRKSVWSSDDEHYLTGNTSSPPMYTWLLRITFTSMTSPGGRPRKWPSGEVIACEVHLPKHPALSNGVSPQVNTVYTNTTTPHPEILGFHMQLKDL